MRSRHGVPARTAAIALAIGLVAAGCDSAKVAGPNGPYDPQGAATAAQNVTGVPADANALSSIGLAADVLAGTISAQLVPGPTSPAGLLPSYDRARRYAEQPAGLPMFPSNLLGKTLVWSTTDGYYVIDPDAMDAPANGVRIIYYAIDPTTQRPAAPLNALGYVDLTDLSTAASTRLGIKVVRTSPTSAVLADYYVDASYTETTTAVTATLGAVGLLSDGSSQVDFDLSQTVTISQSSDFLQLAIDYSVSRSGTDDTIHLIGTGQIAIGQEEPFTFDVTMTVTHDGSTAVLATTLAQDGSIDGQLTYNGDAMVIIGGTAESPTFTHPDGSALSDADVQALQKLWQAIDDLFAFAENVFQPFHHAHDH